LWKPWRLFSKKLKILFFKRQKTADEEEEGGGQGRVYWTNEPGSGDGIYTGAENVEMFKIR
jgi:hypothetical protein